LIVFHFLLHLTILHQWERAQKDESKLHQRWDVIIVVWVPSSTLTKTKKKTRFKEVCSKPNIAKKHPCHVELMEIPNQTFFKCSKKKTFSTAALNTSASRLCRSISYQKKVPKHFHEQFDVMQSSH
jgi:hypothetical protein